ncbi:hypothetical protein U1Q18_038814, partial [Sarracenia purpurea var. burkii]
SKASKASNPRVLSKPKGHGITHIQPRESMWDVGRGRASSGERESLIPSNSHMFPTVWMYYLVQVEEFLEAKTEGEKSGLKFRLLDIMEAMRWRPDGHSNHYGHLSETRFMLYSDCLHWCLPGPIDTWNELLLQVLKMGDGLD